MNDISGRTGLSRDGLDDIASQFRSYFENDEAFLLLTVDVDGTRVRLLNEREVLHMGDVKHLIRRVLLAEWIAGAIAFAFIGGGFALRRAAFWPELGQGVVLSASGLAAAAAVIGGAALVSFEWTFRVFHEISFSNDFWKLAYDDYLVGLFPEPFWFQATLILVVLTTLEMVVVVGAWRWIDRRCAPSGRRNGE